VNSVDQKVVRKGEPRVDLKDVQWVSWKVDELVGSTVAAKERKTVGKSVRASVVSMVDL
jgi:hypothetical protein